MSRLEIDRLHKVYGTGAGAVALTAGVIGAGGFGAVWLATQQGLGRKVAVKLMHAERATDEQEVLRFQEEARVTAQLQHPNIVKVLDHGAGDGRPWIAAVVMIMSADWMCLVTTAAILSFSAAVSSRA